MWRSTLRISIQSVESRALRDARALALALGAGRCIAARAIAVCSHASARPEWPSGCTRAVGAWNLLSATSRGTSTVENCTPYA
jgi:hypothetical protein